MDYRLSPSLLSADFGQLYEDVRKVEEGGADMLHIDVMDGHFVPNITIGPVILQGLEGKTKMPFDVHLMIEDPDRYIDKFVFENTEYISVHQEACTHLHRTVQYIRSLGVKAGVAINPATSLRTLDEILEYIDMVIIMTVNPGFGGQSFIESGLRKIYELREMIEKGGYKVDIEVDGGVKPANARKVLASGANVLVAGSAIFSAEDPVKETKKFMDILKGMK
ncbi:MAG: ribulose-phosphate 3-epimerase [Firmicutes bacterium]|jgi:ribulose-phosphate 3-epimerase|nr:ribulose-phosphate 3-epimerase [Bacillota bacterium]MBR6503475.1 ribulose-phosphate 3-epimerase [Bacillota bacterium]